MEQLNLNGNMTFETIKGKKKTSKSYSWKGSVKGNRKTKNAHILFNAMLDKKKIGVDVNILPNKDATVNVDGEVSKNGKATKVDIQNINITNPEEVKMAMTKVMMSLM